MASSNHSIDQWLHNGERSSISSFSVGSRGSLVDGEASTPRHVPDLSKIAELAEGTSDLTLSSTSQVTKRGFSRQSSASDSIQSPTSQSSESVFSIKSADSDNTATTYTVDNTVDTDSSTEDEDGVPYQRCDFCIAGCRIKYPITRLDDLYYHTLSHFGDLPPPSRCICSFCEVEFEDKEHRKDNWRRRMMHCRDHLQADGYRNPRPDYWLIEYLKDKQLISAHDLAVANQYTERPQVDGLVPRNFIKAGARAQNDRNRGHPSDLRKEERERRRMSQKRDRRETKDE